MLRPDPLLPFLSFEAGAKAPASLSLFQPKLEDDRCPIVQCDPVDIGLVLGQILGADVEYPLLVACTPAKSRVWGSGKRGFIWLQHFCSYYDLEKLEIGDNSRCPDGVPIDICNAELRWNRAALLEHARTVGIDGLKDAGGVVDDVDLHILGGVVVVIHIGWDEVHMEILATTCI